jgi:hypothetical protein
MVVVHTLRTTTTDEQLDVRNCLKVFRAVHPVGLELSHWADFKNRAEAFGEPMTCDYGLKFWQTARRQTKN